MNLIYKEDALACCTDYGFTKAEEVRDAINDLPVVDVSLLKDTKTIYADLTEATKMLPGTKITTAVDTLAVPPELLVPEDGGERIDIVMEGTS